MMEESEMTKREFLVIYILMCMIILVLITLISLLINNTYITVIISFIAGYLVRSKRVLKFTKYIVRRMMTLD